MNIRPPNYRSAGASAQLTNQVFVRQEKVAVVVEEIESELRCVIERYIYAC